MLPSGKPVGVGVCFASQADVLEQLSPAVFGVGSRHPQNPAAREGDVIDHRQVGKQVELLKDHADPGSDRVAFGARVGDVDPGEEDLPIVDLLEQIDAAQQCRFARPARPDQGDHLVGLHVEIDASQHVLVPK